MHGTDNMWAWHLCSHFHLCSTVVFSSAVVEQFYWERGWFEKLIMLYIQDWQSWKQKSGLRIKFSRTFWQRGPLLEFINSFPLQEREISANALGFILPSSPISHLWYMDNTRSFESSLLPTEKLMDLRRWSQHLKNFQEHLSGIAASSFSNLQNQLASVEAQPIIWMSSCVSQVHYQ
jgi:hypothetical protein